MRKVIPLAVAGGVLLASGGVFGTAQAFAKDVEVSQDGVPEKIRTWDGTVGDVLEDRGIVLGEHDVVAPSPTEKLADGQHISVRYGREVDLTIDGEHDSFWTTARTLDEVLSERSIRDESRMSTSRNAAIGREGLSVDIETAKKVVLVVAKEKPRELVTPAETVGDALAEAGVALTPDDRVEPSVETPLVEDLTVTVQKNENRETTRAVDLPFKTIRKDTPSLAAGAQKVERDGATGKAVETWVERVENGETVRNEKRSTKVEKEPVDKIVLVGSRSAPKPPASQGPPAAARDGGPSTGSPSAGSPSASAPRSSGNAPAEANKPSLAPANGTTCVASNYWQGQMTANGERFDPSAMTAAHKTLPFNTRVKVTNPRSGQTVIVRINDRGPFTPGRCIDLSRSAFALIGDTGQGVMPVTYEVL